jgi:uncharacterized protein
MQMKSEADLAGPVSEIVREVSDTLVARLSESMHALILYGSEARGEAHQDSDVDLIVVLQRDDPGLKRAVQDAAYDVMWQRDFDRIISVYVMSLDEFEKQRRRGFSFIRSVERDGVALWKTA